MNKQQKENKIIPDQEKGAKTDTSENVKAYTPEEAKKVFAEAKEKLLDINNWNKLCGIASSIFYLTDEQGNQIHRQPIKGDYIKIDLPAPGSTSGGGFDWVRIEAIEDKSNPEGDTESFAIRVRPAENPQEPGEDTAHFFKEDATSSFLIQRKGKQVNAEVHGRNEIPNAANKGVFDKIRNLIVGLSASTGLAIPQWKSLINGLLGKK
jgi:hypothetical protein